ncbi:MAG: transporter substrate-binding domain-containing protein [Chitinophagales bacterium]
MDTQIQIPLYKQILFDPFFLFFLAVYVALFVAFWQEKDKEGKAKWKFFALYNTFILSLIAAFKLNSYLFTFLIPTFSAIVLIKEVFYPKSGTNIFKRNYGTIKFKRFEDITQLKFSLLEYSPFGYYDIQGNIHGIGIKVLKKIFDFKTIELVEIKGDIGWNNALEKLEDKTLDLILTPLFETRSRLAKNIEFCSPLFYSNIGIYVYKNLETQDLENKLTFSEAIEFIKNKVTKSQWKAKYIVGELSQFLIEKHNLGGKNISQTEINNQVFKQIIDDISSDGAESADFTFMEVFKVESFIKSGAMVVNILKENQLIYPVSFAIRKEHTVLKNLINLRIMEMRAKIEANNRNELENVILGVATSTDVGITEATFDKIFLQKYKFGVLSQG